MWLYFWGKCHVSNLTPEFQAKQLRVWQSPASDRLHKYHQRSIVPNIIAVRLSACCFAS